MKAPIKIFLDPRKKLWPTQRLTQKTLDPRKKNLTHAKIYLTHAAHVKNTLTHATHATQVTHVTTQPTQFSRLMLKVLSLFRKKVLSFIRPTPSFTFNYHNPHSAFTTFAETASLKHAVIFPSSVPISLMKDWFSWAP